jgi:hypothetical protein
VPLSTCYTRGSTAAARGTSGRTFKAGQSTLRKRDLLAYAIQDVPLTSDSRILLTIFLCVP